MNNYNLSKEEIDNMLKSHKAIQYQAVGNVNSIFGSSGTFCETIEEALNEFIDNDYVDGGIIAIQSSSKQELIIRLDSVKDAKRFIKLKQL